MSDQEALRTLKAYVVGLFPKTCGKCGRSFQTMAGFLRAAKHVGPVIAHEDDDADAGGANPLGVSSYFNCVCGTTLVLDSSAMPLRTYRKLRRWANEAAARRGVSRDEFYRWVREQVDAQVLAEEIGRGA